MTQAKKRKTTTEKSPRTVVTADRIDPSSPNADRKVMDTLFEMVTVDKNPTVAMFWARSRCGMSDKGSRKEQKSNQVPTIVIRSEEKRA